jgi:DNA (cytosine-5)-methyltransferase 1
VKNPNSADEAVLFDWKPARKARVIKHASFSFIDLFAGVGGMRLGFESAGGKCVFSSEWDKDSQKTYQANFGELPHGDITQISEEEIPDFDVLLAGFPCQPFSSIGQRQGFAHKTQGTLFYDVLRILEHKRPSAFLLENVVGLVNHDKGNTFKVILASLDEANYEVFYKVLDAADYGVPQHRKRIYIVGFNRDKFKSDIDFEFPQEFDYDVFIGQFVEKGIIDRSVSERLQESYLYKIDDGRPQIIDKKSKIKVKTLVASYHKIQRLTGTFVADGPTGIRLLSENECKAIMGFPKDFIIPVSRTQLYRQMGNSVAVPVVSAIAEEITTTLVGAQLVKGKRPKRAS